MAFYFKFATEGNITIAGRTIQIGEGGLLDVELSDAEKEFMRKSHSFREVSEPAVEPAPPSKGAGSPSSEKVEKKSAPKKAAAKKPAAKKPAAKKKSAPKKKGA